MFSTSSILRILAKKPTICVGRPSAARVCRKSQLHSRVFLTMLHFGARSFAALSERGVARREPAYGRGKREPSGGDRGIGSMRQVDVNQAGKIGGRT
jgi:hypothetical protein